MLTKYNTLPWQITGVGATEGGLEKILKQWDVDKRVLVKKLKSRALN